MYFMFTTVVIGVLIIGGCATTGKISGPTGTDSTLLIGRVSLACSEFPQTWGCNGNHTNGIVIDLRHVQTKEITSIRSKGADGLFFLHDPEEGVYEFIKLSFKKGGSNYTTNLYYVPDRRTYFPVVRNAVNNMGDIHWQSVYQAKIEETQSRKGSSILGSVEDSCRYENNFDELEAWFSAEYPESEWNRRNWVPTNIKTQ